MTIPRLELGISRVSGERVSHCTIQSIKIMGIPLYTNILYAEKINYR